MSPRCIITEPLPVDPIDRLIVKLTRKGWTPLRILPLTGLDFASLLGRIAKLEVCDEL